MRHLRIIVAVSVGAFLAVSVTPALAKEFTTSRVPSECSEASPCRTTGVGIGEPEELHPEYTQKFVFGTLHILCKKAAAHAKEIGEGAITWSSSHVFATEVKFNSCVTPIKVGANTAALKVGFNGGHPMKFVYHDNGFAEFGTGETTQEVEISSGETTFTIANKICKINWPSQTVPAAAVKKPEGEFSAVTYSNISVPVPESQFKKFPETHEQKRMIVANALKGMQYFYEEGQCVGEGGFEEEFKGTEGKSGQYFGAIEEQAVGANLSFVP